MENNKKEISNEVKALILQEIIALKEVFTHAYPSRSFSSDPERRLLLTINNYHDFRK
jgi:hypothetical protein